MSWVKHDSYKLEKEAELQGKSILTLGLAKGVKVEKSKNKKSKKPFDLYILPLNKGSQDNA